MPFRIPAGGIFSATAMGEDMLLVGGDFEKETIGSAARVQFADGHGMQVDALPAPRGYRSGAACFSATACLAVGPTGIDRWDGARWHAVSDIGYDAVDSAGGVAWASGDAGRIVRITPAQAPATSSKP